MVSEIAHVTRDSDTIFKVKRSKVKVTRQLWLVVLAGQHLTFVAYIGPKSRTERLRKTKIGTEVAHVTYDSDTSFKVKGQGHQAALVGCSSHHITYRDTNS